MQVTIETVEKVVTEVKVNAVPPDLLALADRAEAAADSAADARDEAVQSAADALASEQAAAVSEGNALISEQNAAQSASDAQGYATSAGNSASAANTSASNALTSEQNAAQSESGAQAEADRAETAANNASTSESNAAQSASDAQGYANAANQSASDANDAKEYIESIKPELDTAVENANEALELAMQGQFVEVVGNVLPTPDMDKAFAMLPEGVYTQDNGPDVVVPEGEYGVANWNGDTWSLGNTGELPLQQGVDVIDPLGEDLPKEKAVADFIYTKASYRYLFIQMPNTEIWGKAAKAVKELYIRNYDSNYDYQLLQIARSINPIGYPPNLYQVKLLKIEKANPSNTIREDFIAYDLDEGSGVTIIKGNNNGFLAIIDWTALQIGEQFDVDPNAQYTLDPKCGDINNSPTIRQYLGFSELEPLKPIERTVINSQFILGAGNANPDYEPEYNLGIGKNSLKQIRDAGYNTAVGIGALENHRTGAGNVAIGTHAMQNSEECIDVTMMGWEAGRMMTEGVGDTGIGRRSLRNATIATGNTAVGDSSLYSLVPNEVTGKGYGNVAMGYTVAEYCEEITYSVVIGFAGARNIQAGDNNVLIGAHVMFNRSSASEANTAVGANSMYSSTGDRNVAMGAYTLSDCNGNENVTIGYNSGNSILDGNNNTIIGANAQSGATDVTNSVVIGQNAKSTKDNQIVLGNSLSEEIVLGDVVFTKSQIIALLNLVS